MRFSLFVTACALLALLVACVAPHSSSPQRSSAAAHPADNALVREARYVMGTFLDITVRPDETLQDTRELRSIIDEGFAIAQRLDQLLSTWNSESEVSRFNAAAGSAHVPVSPEVCDLVVRSRELSRSTNGVFDITVRPLVELWSTAAGRGRLPSPAQEARARAAIGAEGVECQDGVLIKHRTGAQLETGGIGKGFAVDKIIEHFRSRGVRHAFINFGRSTIAALGNDGYPDTSAGWTVAFDLEGRGVVREPPVRISDETMTVSRAHGTPFVVAGRSYPHLFDPILGAPARTVRGAAVIAPSATAGEAYAKYLALRGADDPVLLRSWGVRWWRVYGRGEVTGN